MLINALRGHMGEFGIIGAAGAKNVPALVMRLHEARDELPPEARTALDLIVDGLRGLDAKIKQAEVRILAWHRANEARRRPATIPGVGPITASAIVATVPDASCFPSGRHFAVWLGLTPQPNSSGGKDRLGSISKQGDGYLRRLLVTGATAVIRFARADSSESKRWAAALLERKPARVATVALANKTARIIWALLIRNQST
jgi:transposase